MKAGAIKAAAVNVGAPSAGAKSAGNSGADTAEAASPLAAQAGSWLEQLRFDDQGLITAIAQEAATQRILMVAWMDRQALQETARTGQAVYWSRSRRRLWHKGEESGNVQKVTQIRTDCDGDVVLLMVEQAGGVACHTGRHSCFFNVLQDERWVVVDPVLADPTTLYRQP